MDAVTSLPACPSSPTEDYFTSAIPFSPSLPHFKMHAEYPLVAQLELALGETTGMRATSRFVAFPGKILSSFCL